MAAATALADVLGPVLPLHIEPDGALTVRFDGTVASLREVTIAEGLRMLSITQVLAWDLLLDAALRTSVAQQANTTMLGTITVTEQPDGRADVLLRYNFPVDGLTDPALQTLVPMVLAGGAAARYVILRRS